jgi:cell division transport system ATP-binding protein
MIHLYNVRKNYPPDQTALQNVTVRVEQGDFLFIAGSSGAGKSTLLKLLFGAEKASSGEVVVGGRNLTELDEHSVMLLRRDIGVIFQDYKLLPRRTVIENVSYGLEVRGYQKEERLALAARMLAAVGLSGKENVFPLTLSGGEQQRVSIARALIHKPRVILADEPTGNLDQQMTDVIFDLLLEANAAGSTVIVATHNLSMIENLNLRTIVLNKGAIVGDFENPRGIG